MRIQIKELRTQPNYTKNNKQNIAFTACRLDITKKAFKTGVEKSNAENYNLSSKDINEIVNGFWKNIKSIKKTFSKDKIIDVTLILKEETVHAYITPGQKIQESMSVLAKGYTEFANEYAFSGENGSSLVKQVQASAEKTKNDFRNIIKKIKNMEEIEKYHPMWKYERMFFRIKKALKNILFTNK